MEGVVQIHVLDHMEGLKQVQVLEDIVWKGDSIPTHQTITAIKNGGLMLGAYIGGKLVGFNYSFPGFKNGKVYLCSHNMGIDPDLRSQGIGAMLKTKQREKAIEIGYDLITWTFDPLETRNAYLNLSKLRAVCDTYIENCYGEVNDGLNNGLPTDRFQVEWWINSEHIAKSQPMLTPDAVIPWEMTKADLPKLAEYRDSLVGDVLHIPVPADFQALKNSDAALALDWRLQTREIFQTLFRAGYTVVALEKGAGVPVHYYVLVKRSTLQLD